MTFKILFDCGFSLIWSIDIQSRRLSSVSFPAITSITTKEKRKCVGKILLLLSVGLFFSTYFTSVNSSYPPPKNKNTILSGGSEILIQVNNMSLNFTRSVTYFSLKDPLPAKLNDIRVKSSIFYQSWLKK